MIQICLILGVLLFAIKKTDFIYSYLGLFGFKDEGYEALKENNPIINYVDFLHLKYRNFYTELLICPFCLGTWLGFIPVVIYGWVGFGIYYLIILITFGILNKIMKSVNS